MRSTNPVLSRPDAFQRSQPGQYNAYDPYAQPYGQPGYAPQQPGFAPSAPAGRMTIEDVITKSGLTMGVLALVAAATYVLMPAAFLGSAMLVGAIVSFVAVMVVSLRRVISPVAVMAYSVIEGVFIGAFSKVFATAFSPGLVPTAIMATFVAAGITLAAYKFLRIKVTSRFRKIVTISTMALMGLYLVNLVLSLLGVHTGLLGFGPGSSLIAMGISALAIVLAVSNLIMDFDAIEGGIRSGAPASESWRAAFGLVVTMVWLYTEILRVLSYFRD